MPLYAYRALNVTGNSEKGTLNAASEREALNLLRDQAIYPLRVWPVRSITGSLRGWIRMGRSQSISSRELGNFLRQFAIG